MTREQKRDMLLQERAGAFEMISNLLLTLDSHRNFHRRVEQIVVETQTRVREINNAPCTPSEQFPCMCHDITCKCEAECKREATQQVHEYEDPLGLADDSTTTSLMCDQCANHALHTAKATIIEERPYT